MFRNRILMGVAHAPGIRLLRQSAEATKCLAILFLVLTENVSRISCGPNAINTASDGYASWAATRAGAVGGPLAAPAAVAAAPMAAGVDAHRLAKRMDLELCLGKFEVHKNTIIRTGESQTLGGKFLQGLELETAEECQRLCCETESCDVYVFEDKSDGYCYLFECGPPENFHCKFTRHANYTSAVLTVARHVTEVTTTKPSVAHIVSANNISQQEWELTSLKVKPETRDKTAVAPVVGGVEGTVSGVPAAGSAVSGSANVVATAGTVPMLGVEQIPPLSVAFPQKVYPVHCGRFQFTCHSGECIAVYNACDGIPQCEDGSDEGPECSAATSTAKSNADVSSANAMEPKIALKSQYQLPLVQPQLLSVHQVEQTQQKQQQQQQQLMPQMLPGVVPPLINNREDAGAWANRKTAVSDANHSEQETNDVDLNSRIFSHKGGIQVPTTGVNANNNPNSVMVNSYANIDNNNNNPNLNLNPVYNAATLQHSGIYLPQMTDLSKGGVYVPQQQQPSAPQQQQQQQYEVPQGHMMLPPSVQWQMQQQSPPQQQQQQQMMSQQPQQAPSLPMPLQPGPAYIINTAGQQQQPAVAPAVKAATAETAHAATASTATHAAKTALQQQQQSQVAVQQSGAQVALPAATQSNAAPVTTAQKPDASKVASKTVETQAAAEEDYEDSGEEEKSTEAPKKKHKHKKLAAIPKADVKKKPQLDPIELALEEQRQRAPAPLPVHEQYRMIHENLGLEFRDHDGQSERPGGAMLSLTLGLLVTAALAILIGCRMRTVSRRTRRMGGKTPYSHEADFLVNGMYL